MLEGGDRGAGRGAWRGSRSGWTFPGTTARGWRRGWSCRPARRGRTRSSPTASPAPRTSSRRRRIAEALARRGVAVLRFDFTGLGASEGEFANTNFSSNVADLVAAADYLRARQAAPALLVGHSLGGAAVLAAAGSIPEVRAVATIGAPADAGHVVKNFAAHLDRIAAEGAAEVTLAGRRFTIRRQFLEDLDERAGSRAGRGAEAAAPDLPRPARRDRRHRERRGDLRGGEASQELRLARRRRPPAAPARGRDLRRRGAGGLGSALPARAGGAGRRPGAGDRDRRRAIAAGGAGGAAQPDRRRAGRRRRRRHRARPLRLSRGGAGGLHRADLAHLRPAEGPASSGGSA